MRRSRTVSGFVRFAACLASACALFVLIPAVSTGIPSLGRERVVWDPSGKTTFRQEPAAPRAGDSITLYCDYEWAWYAVMRFDGWLVIWDRGDGHVDDSDAYGQSGFSPARFDHTYYKPGDYLVWISGPGKTITHKVTVSPETRPPQVWWESPPTSCLSPADVWISVGAVDWESGMRGVDYDAFYDGKWHDLGWVKPRRGIGDRRRDTYGFLWRHDIKHAQKVTVKVSAQDQCNNKSKCVTRDVYITPKQRQTVAADVEGDGLIDLVTAVPDGIGTSLHTFSNSGNALKLVKSYTDLALDTSSFKLLAGDVDGDKADELLLMKRKPDNSTEFSILDLVSGLYEVSTTWHVRSWNWYTLKAETGDFDKDGRDEIYVLQDGSELYLWLCHFYEPFDPEPIGEIAWRPRGGWDWSRMSLVSGDFDGDRRDTLAVLYDYVSTPRPGTGLWFFDHDDSRGMITRKYALLAPNWSAGWNSSDLRATAGDTDGDSKDELAVCSNASGGQPAIWTAFDFSHHVGPWIKKVWSAEPGLTWGNRPLRVFGGGGGAEKKGVLLGLVESSAEPEAYDLFYWLPNTVGQPPTPGAPSTELYSPRVLWQKHSYTPWSLAAPSDDLYVFPRRYEQNEAAIFYDGDWTSVPPDGDDELKKRLAGGGSATITFAGSSIDLVSATGPDLGKMAVSLDGGAREVVDLYGAASADNKTVYHSPPVSLEESRHTLKLWSLGTKRSSSSGTDITLDAVLVRGELKPVFDQAYYGRWDIEHHGELSGGSQLSTTEMGAWARIKFKGNEVQLTASRGPGQGIARIALDDRAPVTCDMYSASTIPNAVIFEQTEIGEGNHTLTYECTGEKSPSSSSSRVGLDTVSGREAAFQRSRYEQDHPYVAFTGSSIDARGPFSAGTERRTEGGIFSFQFVGSGITLVGRRGPDCADAVVRLDNREWPLALHSSNRLFEQQVLTLDNLSPGVHTLSMGIAGANPTRGKYIGLDAVDVMQGTLTRAGRPHDLGASSGVSLVSAPAVTSISPGRLDVFVRGSDGGIWWKTYSGSWGPFKRLTSSRGSVPAVASRGRGRMDLFWRDPNGRLMHMWYWRNLWRSEVLVPTTGVPVSLRSAPAVATSGAGKLEVFFSGWSSRLGRQVYESSYSNGRWITAPLGGITTSLGQTASLAAVCPEPGRIELSGLGANGALLRMSKVGRSWGERQWQEYFKSSTQLAETPALCEGNPRGSFVTWVRGTDNRIYYRANASLRSEDLPTAWATLIGTAESSPGAVSHAPGYYDVFAVEHGRLKQWSYSRERWR